MCYFSEQKEINQHICVYVVQHEIRYLSDQKNLNGKIIIIRNMNIKQLQKEEFTRNKSESEGSVGCGARWRFNLTNTISPPLRFIYF